VRSPQQKQVRSWDPLRLGMHSFWMKKGPEIVWKEARQAEIVWQFFFLADKDAAASCIAFVCTNIFGSGSLCMMLLNSSDLGKEISSSLTPCTMRLSFGKLLWWGSWKNCLSCLSLLLNLSTQLISEGNCYDDEQGIISNWLIFAAAVTITSENCLASWCFNCPSKKVD